MGVSRRSETVQYGTMYGMSQGTEDQHRGRQSVEKQQAHPVYLKEAAVVSRGLGHGEIGRSTKATGAGVICCGIVEVLARVTLVEC